MAHTLTICNQMEIETPTRLMRKSKQNYEKSKYPFKKSVSILVLCLCKLLVPSLKDEDGGLKETSKQHVSSEGPMNDDVCT